jgi:CDP-diacylglycerol pyrophosphatase
MASSLPFWGCISLLALLSSPSRAADNGPLRPPHRAATSAVSCPVPSPPPPNPNALWNLVGCCIQGKDKNNRWKDIHCEDYNKTYQYILAKDASSSKKNAYLIIPTIQMPGIESSLTLSSPTLDIWQDGWSQSQGLLKPPKGAKIGLAINSALGRDQNQLHIHIACVRSDVLKTLAGTKNFSIDPAKPTKLILPPNNNPYEAIQLSSLAGNSSPFKVVRLLPHVSSSNIREQSIAIVEGPQSQTWILLNTHANGQNKGEAEELLNQQACSP